MSAPTRWLLLPVEVKARGFEGRLLLGAHAAAGGWKVVVGRKNQLNAAVHDLPRGLYFDKSIQSQAIEQIRYFKALGNTYAAIDEEGLVHEGGPSTYVKRRLSRDTLAAGAAPNTPAALRAWMRDPHMLKAGALMPNMQLSDTELDQIVAYLLTLK